MINPTPRAARLLVLLAAFVCAACGLVYELELVALGSYLLGDSVTEASVVLSVMVCAMGVGSLLAKRFTLRPAASFAVVESLLALVGGLSVIGLYGCYVWLGHYQAALVGFASLIGLLIGAEIPLLMTLMQRIRRQEAGRAVADLFAADYVGALVGGLAFPFLLLPTLGQLTGALLTGVVNTVSGGLIAFWLFRAEPARRERLLLGLCSGAVVLVLGVAWAGSGAFERAAQRRLYGAPVRVSAQSRFQQIILTGGPGGPGGGEDAARLYLGGRLAVCGRDQAAYHAALTDPALSGGRRARVLVLGGGDGLAARHILDTPGVARVTVVDQDPVLLRLATEDPVLHSLNGGALDDPRVQTVTADAFGWLRTAPLQEHPYDVIVADLPSAGLDAADKLYTREFYGLVRRMLAPGGRLVVHAGDRLWSVADTVRAVGLTPYGYEAVGRDAAACGEPATGDASWHFVLASAAPLAPGSLRGVKRLREPSDAPQRVATLLGPL
ncbi:polyamine aminopropyltransferase [Streptacidiphilus melanogenes]|uniref:polyamine aminopropyltransferase n=1 Tax=Streptacidiphilus melanogenes TaxID=411235 RepID=UPI000AFD06DD|nr:polyamine aminopropyltransferase [Streptacidiphilus melanogenes]